MSELFMSIGYFCIEKQKERYIETRHEQEDVLYMFDVCLMWV